MIDPVYWCLAGIVLALMAGNLWLAWLYIVTYRMLTVANRDRDRLIRRIGVYHSLPLITPYETLPQPEVETPLPSFFRMKRPQPPPGWKGPSKGDL